MLIIKASIALVNENDYTPFACVCVRLEMIAYRLFFHANCAVPIITIDEIFKNMSRPYCWIVPPKKSNVFSRFILRTTTLSATIAAPHIYLRRSFRARAIGFVVSVARVISPRIISPSVVRFFHCFAKLSIAHLRALSPNFCVSFFPNPFVSSHQRLDSFFRTFVLPFFTWELLLSMLLRCRALYIFHFIFHLDLIELWYLYFDARIKFLITQHLRSFWYILFSFYNYNLRAHCLYTGKQNEKLVF